MSVYCPQCGAPANDGAFKCEYCGATISQPAQQQPAYQQPVYQQNVNPFPDVQAQVGYINSTTFSEKSGWPVKSKLVAILLAFFLGGLGIHQFYLGKSGKGVLYLLFCWTYIPGIIAFIDMIMLIVSNNETLENKYKVRFN